VATLRPVSWLLAGCAVSLLAVSAALDQPGQRAAAWAGMLGPLLAAVGTLVVAGRTPARAPERAMAVTVHLFFVKVVFFLGYVTLAIRVVALDPLPFIVSFAVYFVGSYLALALWLQRRFVRGLNRAR
jgi:hypothetical protein